MNSLTQRRQGAKTPHARTLLLASRTLATLRFRVRLFWLSKDFFTASQPVSQWCVFSRLVQKKNRRNRKAQPLCYPYPSQAPAG
jgi:hypothetical protein